LKVVKAIENKSEYSFFYNEKIDVNIPVSIVANQKSVKEILDKVLLNTQIKYKILGRQIAFYTKDEAEPFLNQKQIPKITGIVNDENGESIPGVTVRVKGTKSGVITDVKGNYSFTDISENSILQFNFIGMKMQEIVIGNKTIINVTLMQDAVNLEEVVAIGYGSAKKSDITGSMTHLTSEKFNSGVILAPEQLMQGKVSGVNITLNSGEPGANSKIVIRGGTSINASNDPLYVIDGVPVGFDAGSFLAGTSDRQATLANNPLNMINSSDIESINVLKDASATAIYGSRGANGVIIVTTKKGKDGKSTIEYESSVGVSSIRKKLDVLSADQYRTYMNSDSIKLKVTGWKDGGANTDWQDQIFRNGIIQSHNLALLGGSNNTNYRASLNYTNQQGTMIASDLEKITGRININHKAFNDKLNISLFMTSAFLKGHSAPNAGGVDGKSGGTLRDALRNDPTYPVKDANDVYTWHGPENPNPVEETLVRSDETNTYRNMGNAILDYKFTNYLSFNTNIGFTKENVDRMTYEPNSGRIGSVSHGNASHQFRNDFSKLLETNLVFNKKFGMHSINALAGYSFQEFVNTGAYMQASNFISDATTYNAIGNGDKNTYIIYTWKNSHKLISFYGRVTYDLNNKYLFTATVRQDGSTRFGSNNKWGTFPSAAIGWRISEEEFLKPVDFISNLKLRVGYGVTGNQEIGDYISLPTLSAGGNTYIIGGKQYTAVGSNQYYNPDLKWESTAQTNIGLDFGFFNSRLSGSLDVYKKTTNDLLLSFAVPSPAVIPSFTDNVGQVENRGIELELNGVIVKSKKFGWDAYANISHNENKVLSISNSKWKQEQIYTGSTACPGFSGVTTQIIKPGLPLGTFYGYEYLGVDAKGKQIFNDLNTDGKILPGDDRKVIGNSQPDFTYGFGSKFTVKRFSIDIFFRGVQGVTILNSTQLDMADKTKLYTPLTDNARVNIGSSALTDGLAYNEMAVYSSKWIQDASYLRLENVTLNYNFNVSAVKWLSRLNLYLTGQNLLVITKYDGFDPEVSNGLDAMNYPRPTTIVCGIKAQF